MRNFNSNDAMNLADGSIFVDGDEKTNGVSLEVVFTINSAEVPILGRRNIGDKALTYKITGTLTEYKATDWLINYCKNFQNNGKVKPFDIQATLKDKNSRYYKDNGEDRIALKNCVLTGDIPIFNLDVGGEVVQNEINFTADMIV